MSFGLGISFGRLCRREHSLHEVYADARRIEGWERREDPPWIREYNPRKGIIIYNLERIGQVLVSSD